MMTTIDSSDSAFVAQGTTDATWQEITLLQTRKHSVLYRAKRYGRWFVLKGLPLEQQYLTDSLMVQDKEFRFGLQLVHPNIVATYSLEDVPDCGRCIVMEAVDGQTLDSWLATGPDRQKRMRVLLQLLDAVEYLHARQLVHHDLKPSNILITHNGENLKLIDFGLSNSDDVATVVPNDLQDDIARLVDVMALFRLRALTPIIRKCKRGKYKNIAELRADIMRRGRVAKGVYAVLMSAALVVCAGLSWQAVREHQMAQQALEDAHNEMAVFEQERQKQAEEKAEQERRQQAVVADVNAVYDREDERLNKIVRCEKYRELAMSKFFVYNRHQALSDSLNRVYPPSDALINYLCNTTCTQRWNEQQKAIMKQVDKKPSLSEEYQQGHITAEEYQRLLKEQVALSQSLQPHSAY